MYTLAVAGVRERIHGLLSILGLACSIFGPLATDAAFAQKQGTDIFDSPYVYLLRGDENFSKFATNYLYTVPIPDSTVQIEALPLPKQRAQEEDTAYYFTLTLERAMSVRIIFTDSSATGLAVYDFPRVSKGDYTFGAKHWPANLQELIAGKNGINVYFVADAKYHSRFRFDVGPEGQSMRAVRTLFRTK